MPVLPLVGSTMTVSRSTRPARSPASIMARPMRSFTLASGLKNSHLASTVACSRGTSRLMRTSGVPPIVSVMSLKMRPWGLRGMSVRLSVREFGRIEGADRDDERHVDDLQLAGRDDDVDALDGVPRY